MAHVGGEVALAGVTKRFEGRGAGMVLKGLDLTVAPGELLVLVGPSGCGKSTTLRLVAGLDDPDGGDVKLDGRSMLGVPPQLRDVAMVFQGYALYPHMTAREIMEFPLKMRGVAKAERASRVDEAAKKLSITKLLSRTPDQMSGGERQRVAMGRAIVRRPKVFLFDEPLSNLDAALRGDIRLEIGQLVREMGATALYVTHDQVEAMTLADRIAVMKGGVLEQVATPREIYERPASSFVGAFIGSPQMNLVPATVTADAIEAGPFRLKARRGLPARVEVGVRPEDVRVGKGGASGKVVAVEPLGAETHLVIDVDGGPRLRARMPGFEAGLRDGAVTVSLDEARLHFFDPERDGKRVEPS